MSYRTVAIALALLAAGRVANAEDKPGCKDHPLFPVHMPNYEIGDCKVLDYEAYEFVTAKGPRQREEGKLTFITYRRIQGRPEATALEVVRNYEAAFVKVGGTIVFSDPRRWANGKVVRDGREVWFQVERGNNQIWLRIIEKKPMEQHIVADAAALAGDLDRTGHVAVEGIYFDTNKATIKPESTPALEQVAKLMKGNAKLRLWVVGHTDATGTVDDNLRLAQARAEAVVATLTNTHGIAPARLKGYGSGPFAPVASNDTDEGRARNRRVELVKQP